MIERSLNDIFRTEVRAFSTYDCERSLPSGVDGFATAQRKVIYGMRKKYPSAEVKLSVASAGIMEISGYHHGSIDGVMVKMAQKYPGSNNMPFLDDIGQFGSRLSPKASASRYIFTKLNTNFRKVFKSEDESILDAQFEEGQEIEPKYYLPVIPNILLNGARGTGTGYACKLFSYNPKDLVESCLAVLNNKPQKKLVPWYKGSTGKITKEDTQVHFYGVFERLNSTTLKITELPIGIHTTSYRETLNDLEEAGHIKSYDDNSTEDKTEFVVTCPRATLAQPDTWIYSTFKLIERDSEFIYVWNENEKVQKFETPEDLVRWFVKFRTGKYEVRRQKQISELTADLVRLNERVRFIRFYLANADWFSKTKKMDVESKLTSEGFVNIVDLMSIRLYNLTLDQIVDLEQEVVDTQKMIDDLNNTTATAMYSKELKELKF